MAKPKIEYYKVRSDNRAPKAKVITKYDSDIEVVSEYHMTYFESSNGGYYDCSCPAPGFSCRHKEILRKCEEAGQIDGDRFYDKQNDTFVALEDIR